MKWLQIPSVSGHGGTCLRYQHLGGRGGRPSTQGYLWFYIMLEASLDHVKTLTQNPQSWVLEAWFSGYEHYALVEVPSLTCSTHVRHFRSL